MSESRSCAVEGCESAPKTKGLCVKHYTRWIRHGSTDATRKEPQRAKGLTCPVEGCDRPQNYHGMCGMHARRVERNGDPHSYTPHKDRNNPTGEDHHGWAGDGVTYFGMHIRLRKRRGPASAHPCGDCGSPAAQWSYDRLDPGEHRDESGLVYSTDLEHYIARCVPCHKRFDLAHIAAKSAVALLEDGDWLDEPPAGAEAVNHG